MRIRIKEAIEVHNYLQTIENAKANISGKFNHLSQKDVSFEVYGANGEPSMSRMVKGLTEYYRPKWLDKICNICSVPGYHRIDWNFLRGLPSEADIYYQQITKNELDQVK